MENPGGTEVIRYKISPARRSLIWWIMSPILLMAAAVLLAGEPGAGLCLLGIVLPMTLFVHWYVGRTVLEVSAWGVRQRNGRLVLEAPWPEVERLVVDRGGEGIVVRSPMAGKAAERLAAVRGMMFSGQSYYDDEQQRYLGEQRLIPIQPFAWVLKNGRLLADLDRFAPALAGETREALAAQEAAKSLPKPPMAPAEKRRWAVTITVIVAALALGLYFAINESAVSQAVENWFFAVAYAAVSPLLVLVAAWSTWNSFRARPRWWVMVVLFALLTLVSVGGCLVSWGELLRLIKGR